ncbi:hypothetical protein B296_00003315 [Ensete ventricosum]|uniref:Retrotransposon gag domain-containing protein n=1 Tax=Ensete ventricosum TaxID=4639 RepID=A0A427B5M7_ENSVE|nr:hypothetical protein B296_00003315 [Ensete ventricosum]
MRVEFPICEDGDPIGCISHDERYFRFHKTPEESMVDVVIVHLEGDAIRWYDWFEHMHDIPTRRKLKRRLGGRVFAINTPPAARVSYFCIFLLGPPFSALALGYCPSVLLPLSPRPFPEQDGMSSYSSPSSFYYSMTTTSQSIRVVDGASGAAKEADLRP